MNLEIASWLFQDQRKNPSIDRPATEFETGILEELIQFLPKEVNKQVFEF